MKLLVHILKSLVSLGHDFAKSLFKKIIFLSIWITFSKQFTHQVKLVEQQVMKSYKLLSTSGSMNINDPRWGDVVYSEYKPCGKFFDYLVSELKVALTTIAFCQQCVGLSVGECSTYTWSVRIHSELIDPHFLIRRQYLSHKEKHNLKAGFHIIASLVKIF